MSSTVVCMLQLDIRGITLEGGGNLFLEIRGGIICQYCSFKNAKNSVVKIDHGLGLNKWILKSQ